MKLLKGVRGTKDIFGEEGEKYRYITKVASEVFENYGFTYIKTPIFEETALFQRGIGEGTDVVSKEMYTFQDRGERSLTLRPEGTAAVVRSYLEHKVYGREDISKYYYMGSMFRYERPQAGRQREFNQFGVEVLGEKNPVVDAEVITMGYRLLEKLNISDLELRINSIGGKESRTKYRENLISFLDPHIEELCGDCKTRYKENPLRVLDCKVDGCKEIVKDAPKITEFLNEEEGAHFTEVKRYLELFGVKYVEDSKLVRGLDYYSSTVYEIVTNKLGAQGTVLGGGRYDGLLMELGNKDIPAFGFAAGIERIMMLLDEIPVEKNIVYLAWLGEASGDYGFEIAQKLRDSGVKLEISYQSRSMKANLKKADKLGARYAIIVGEEEVKNKKLVLKDLSERTQEELEVEEVIKRLK